MYPYSKQDYVRMANKNIVICLIDDSIAVGSLFKAFYENQEIILDYFTSYQEFVKNRRPHYDIIIYDWNLSSNSEKTGKILIEETKNEFKHKIIHTGMSDQAGEIVRYAVENKILYVSKNHENNIFDEINRLITYI